MGSNDGCNNCVCTQTGKWACTQKHCGDNSCPIPLDNEFGCPSAVTYYKNPMSGHCCKYLNPCAGPDGWEKYNQGGGNDAEQNCNQAILCAAGESKPASDSCNTCVCLSGLWACTTEGCP